MAANKNKMVGATRTYYYRRCKRIRWSVVECIPDEVIFEILLRLLAQDVYFGARLVCRKWYDITRTKYFIRKHLEHASYGLLCMDKSRDLVFISAREDGGGMFNTYKINYKCHFSRRAVWSCWDGFMLECGPTSGKITYYVVNPSTHQDLRLPECPYKIPFYAVSAIGYDATSMTYKVVAPFQLEGSYGNGCAIFTVGVDKSWRVVRTNHLSDRTKLCIISSYPVVTEGFVHWKGTRAIPVVSLNLETEMILEAHSPLDKLVLKAMTSSRWYSFSTGRYLSLFYKCGYLEWNFFVMNTGTRYGEWKKFPNICLRGEKGKMERLGINFNAAKVINFYDVDAAEPWGWLKYPEVLALRVGYDVIFYNCITCEVSVEIFSISRIFARNSLIKNSLVWLGGS